MRPRQVSGKDVPEDKGDGAQTASGAAHTARTRARRRTAALSRGTNQSGVRQYNERLVLSLVRHHVSLAKAEIARRTGLSAQTVSVIMKQLEGEGLVVKRAPLRGRVGQPSVPFALNPDGAFSLGLKIGRRSADLILMDFVGGTRATMRRTYDYPDPAQILEVADEGVAEILAGIPAEQIERIAGIGIAAPFEIWNWEDEVNAPRAVLDAWRAIDIRSAVAERSAWPVYYSNDATSACAAELVFGNGRQYLDFLYIFLGSFVGGGVVLNGNLFPGPSGNAGVLGPMPVPGGGGSPATRPLLHTASIYALGRQLAAANIDPGFLWRSPDDWGPITPPIEAWIDSVVASLAVAVVAATSVIDFEAIIVDGAFPAVVRERLIARLREEILTHDRQGLTPVRILAGAIGSGARAMGGATLPFLANFTRDREALFSGERLMFPGRDARAPA